MYKKFLNGLTLGPVLSARLRLLLVVLCFMLFMLSSCCLQLFSSVAEGWIKKMQATSNGESKSIDRRSKGGIEEILGIVLLQQRSDGRIQTLLRWFVYFGSKLFGSMFVVINPYLNSCLLFWQSGEFDFYLDKLTSCNCRNAVEQWFYKVSLVNQFHL